MNNIVCSNCGGCPQRSCQSEEYKNNKINSLTKTLSYIKSDNINFDAPVFIEDGQRRRCNMEFVYVKKEFKLGFYEAGTHNLLDISQCPMLDSKINDFLPKLRSFLELFCQIQITKKQKKKIDISYIRKGSVDILLADNGIDVLLNIDIEPVLEHRLEVADFVNNNPELLRLSWKVGNNKSEAIVEKLSPQLHISGYNIDVPSGVFLQASKEAENKMIAIVVDYLANTTGKVADLFCGLGTFTYPLASNPKNEILAIDSSKISLSGLNNALNKNQIHNVKVENKNLFKYPLDSNELKGIKAIIIDPPRAGAHAQVAEISNLEQSVKPEKIVFVSCNPKTFVYDANLLIDGGYNLDRITLIDQFVYSNHEELIALFTLKK